MSLLSELPDEIYIELVGRAQLVLGEDWRPHGVSEVLLRTFAGAAAEINANWNERLETEIVESQGDLLRIPIQDGLPATSTVTVTAIDSVGYTLPAGTPVWVGGSSGNAIECATTVDLVIAPASSSGSVAIETADLTAEHNGATGTVDIDALDWVDSIVLDDPLDDGVDPETADEYRARLADETQLLAVAISRPADAVTWCLRNQSVGWAYAIDHYNADTVTDDVPLCFSVVVADADGEPVDSGVLTELQDGIEALRDSNYVIVVTNATYTPIDVTCEVVPQPGWSEADAIANATAAITTAVSPSTHIAAPNGADPDYLPPTRIYTTDLIAAARNADGVKWVIPSTFEIGDGSTDYVDLATPIDLPEPGTISVTAA